MARLLAALTAASSAVQQVAALPGAAPGDRLTLLHQLRREIEAHIADLSHQVAAVITKQSQPRQEGGD